MQILIHLNSDVDDQNISTLPWLLIEKQSKDAKVVVEKIKFPIGYYSNIKNILIKKGELGGVKTHDWHTLIKVIILVYIFLYW
jgi:hypothetical protein